MQSLGELMRQAEQARRDGRLGDAHRQLAEAVALCRQAGDEEGLIRALEGLGQIERDLGRGEAARPLYEEAVAICRRRDDDLMLAHAVRHLGDIHRDAGRPELAEPCYDEAIALYRSSERARPLDLANSIRPLAILRQRSGSLEEARRLWKEARELYAGSQVGEGVAECSARLEQLGRVGKGGEARRE